jgi:hypothetical protein
MAHVRGARRIKGLGIALALCGTLLAFPLWLLDLYINKVGYGDLAVMISLPLFLGGIIYGAGWSR